jgi:hypothetical protein
MKRRKIAKKGDALNLLPNERLKCSARIGRTVFAVVKMVKMV